MCKFQMFIKPAYQLVRDKNCKVRQFERGVLGLGSVIYDNMTVLTEGGVTIYDN